MNEGQVNPSKPITYDFLKDEIEHRIENEIMDALGSPVFGDFKLGQIAKIYGVTFDSVKGIAELLARRHFSLDLEQIEFNSVVQQITALESVSDPGLREWKLQSLARKFRRTSKQLMEAYNKALVRQAPVNPMTPLELKDKYRSGIDWLVQGWVPKGSVLLLHGDGGTGKSLFTYQLIEAVVKGQPWQGYETTKGKVLLVQCDEPGVVLSERLEMRGIGDNQNLSILEDWQIEAIGPLEATIVRDKPSLIVIDSLTAINRNSIFSENDTEYARPVLQLTALANRTQTTIIIIHHSNAAGNARGTRAIHNSVSEVWALGQGAGPAERKLRVQKMRLGRPPGTYIFRFNDEDLGFTYGGEDNGEDNDLTLTQEKRILLWMGEADRKTKYFAAQEISEFLNLSQPRARYLLYELWSKGLLNRQKTTTNRGQTAYLYGISVQKKGDRVSMDDHLSITFDDHLSNPEPERVSENYEKGDRGDRQFFKNIEPPSEFLENGRSPDHLSLKPAPLQEKKVIVEGDRPSSEDDHLSSDDHLSPEVGDIAILNDHAVWIRRGSSPLPFPSSFRPSQKKLPRMPLYEMPDEAFQAMQGAVYRVVKVWKDRATLRDQETGSTHIFDLAGIAVIQKRESYEKAQA